MFKDRNFVSGCIFMVVIGVVLFGTMALVTPFMQNLPRLSDPDRGLSCLAHAASARLLTMMVAPRLMRMVAAALSDPVRPVAGRRHALLHDRFLARRDARRRSSFTSIIQGVGLGLLFVPISHGRLRHLARPFAHGRDRDH